MGLIDNIFKKEDGKKERKVGSEFDKSQADEIFDKLDEHDIKEKKVSESLKKEMDHTKESFDLVNQAKDLESSDADKAVELYKKAIAINPDNGEVYQRLANIYRDNNDTQKEIEILKLGIKNLEGDRKTKDQLMKRLKELNS